MSHTILLVQPSKSPASRTYSDYENLSQALNDVCKMFEAHLKDAFPTAPKINYKPADLFAFIDRLTDMSCLVLNPSSGTYTPHNRQWIKDKVLNMLTKVAGQ